MEELLYIFLFSLSPFGEARLGITYGILNDVHVVISFLIGLFGNVLVYPLMMWLIKTFNQSLWSFRPYKKAVVWISQFAKRAAGPKISKYGFWGLMIFVMVPLPGTGAYMGTIAAAIFRLQHREAFLSITLGLILSSIIVAVTVYYGSLGWASI